MGQAWCKEKSDKAQDSKSPLDRVFVRCAHRIYPGLKEEASVLGGATQRVTSSEIGYASSPHRQVLTRGQSIDSVDRPFHPSDWVDVNLEVPVTPRSIPAMTNSTHNTNAYTSRSLATGNSSSGTNLRDTTPIPPPRRRKKNHGRPLPPEPDEIAKCHVDRVKMKSPKESSQVPVHCSAQKRTSDKEIFEHKVNGTGRVIPSIVVAGGRSHRERSPRGTDDTVKEKDSRPKNCSTVSLPNYSELVVVPQENVFGDDEEDVKIRKITAAGSLPVLITSGVLENLKKLDNDKKPETIEGETINDEKIVDSVDEIDNSFDLSKNLHSILKFDEPRTTSTPVKQSFDSDSRSPTTAGGWFLHQGRSVNFASPKFQEKDESANTFFYDCTRNSANAEVFLEADENEMENEENRGRPRTGLRKTLSNESEPFEICEEKELCDSEIRLKDRTSKLMGRTISEESLPQAMLDHDTDFFEDKDPTIATNPRKNDEVENGETRTPSSGENDLKTPPPSPEPKIRPEILDNDHSTLLKVLRDEASGSNLSSMTPSLTELEAALSDMLEREDDQASSQQEENSEEKSKDSSVEKPKLLETPIEPKIVRTIDVTGDEKSPIAVSLKNILGELDYEGKRKKCLENIEIASAMVDIDLTNGSQEKSSIDEKSARIDRSSRISDRSSLDPSNNSSLGEPPEKPSRLYSNSHKENVDIFDSVPTPPKRKNRYSGYSGSILNKQEIRSSNSPSESLNDRLI